jgi:predicted RNA-binding protein YlqC (UPF0109 family)
MAALMLQIVQALVDEPDAVRVVPRQTELGIVLDISVAPGDLGKVIGKQGRTARSLRTILCAASTTTGVIHHLDLLQDQPQERVGN